MERYGIINQKNKREIVLLRGGGCKWRKCSFCDYHTDFSKNQEENFKLNESVLKSITGIYGKLEVINSGSFCDLDEKTMSLIISVCKRKNIDTLHFECHYMHRECVENARKLFIRNGITLKIKTGVETFDTNYRENIMKKGFGNASPQKIAEYADEACLLFGLDGQTEISMVNDIEIGLKYFERICINIMNENSTPVFPDKNVINIFADKIYPLYKDNPRIDILFENTDFGVGTKN